MKLFYFFFLLPFFATAQTKKIDFFGTEFLVNNSCDIKQGQMNSCKYGKNALIWADAPPEMVRNMLLGALKDKIKEMHDRVTTGKDKWHPPQHQDDQIAEFFGGKTTAELVQEAYNRGKKENEDKYKTLKAQVLKSVGV